MQTMKKEKLFNRNFVIIVIGIAALYIGYQVTGSVFSVFINSLGNGAAVTGAISLAWTITAVIVRPLAGSLSDAKGTKKIALLGGILFGAGLFAMIFVTNAYIILVLRIIQACGHACLITASLTAAHKSVPLSRSGEGAFFFNGIPQTASQFVGGNLGVALVGVAGVSYVVGNSDYFMVFTVSTLLVVIAVLCNFLQKKDIEAESDSPAAEKKEEVSEEVIGKGISRVIEVSAIVPALIYLFGAIGFQGFQSYVTLFASVNDLGGVGLFFTANGIAQFVMCLFAGKITDKFGNLPILVPSLVLGALSYVYMIAGGTNFFVLGILWGVAAGLLKSPCIAMGMNRCPKGREGKTQGTLNIAFAAGLGLAAFVWGFVIDAFGFSGFFKGSIIMTLATLVFTIIAVKKMKM